MVRKGRLKMGNCFQTTSTKGGIEAPVFSCERFLCFKRKPSKQKRYKHSPYFQKKSSENHISFSDDLSLLCFDAYKVP